MLSDQLHEFRDVIEDLKKNDTHLQSFFNKALDTLKNKNKIIFCGNGGSAAEAQHLSAELVGRFKHERKSLSSVSLTVDTSAITAIANDYGFDKIFERQLEGIGVKGDLLILLSTSGNSKNLILAAKKAKDLGITTSALLGNKGGALKDIVQYSIIVNSDKTDRIQEAHLFLGHILCEFLEKNFFNL